MNKIPITAVIITKNEAEMLPACLDTLEWCSDVIVIDDGSTDDTAKIAEKHGARVISFSHTSFARLRNEALKHCKTDWIFYIDADERVTPTLAKEIMVTIETTTAVALTFLRKNIFLGTHMDHGGWENDLVTRVFKRSFFTEWTGEVHESPHFKGESTTLQTPLIHFSHRDVVSGLFKTAHWTPIEATLLYKAGIPAVTPLTIIRKGFFEFVRRGFIKNGYQDGQAGLVEAIIQGINRMLVYIQVWEHQQTPSFSERYQNEENRIHKLWKEAS